MTSANILQYSVLFIAVPLAAYLIRRGYSKQCRLFEASAKEFDGRIKQASSLHQPKLILPVNHLEMEISLTRGNGKALLFPERKFLPELTAR